MTRKQQRSPQQPKRPRSDATFWRNGTTNEHCYWGPAVAWWWRLAGWKKHAAPAGCLVLAWGFVEHRTGTEWLLAVALGPAAGWGGVWLVRRWFAWGHYRARARPLYWALAGVMEVPPRPRDLLRVPLDYATSPDARVVIYPGDEFTGSDRDRQDVTLAVTAKLGLEAPDSEWNLGGRKPSIVFTKSEPPPAKVAFADVKTAIEAAAPHEIIMGLGKKSQVITVSVDNDSPHIGLSMGSGDGKSVTARNMGAQMLHHGCLLMVLDYKLISHMWARDLPNVSYAGTPPEIEAALVWLEGEVNRRNRVALSGADIEGEVHADVGPRILVIAEELNSTQQVLKKWWQREMGFKGRSPGAEALDQAMFLGRQVRVNVLQIGQRLSVKAAGSGDARENLGVLVFADATASAWKMLVGDRHALPPASGHKGRLQVVTKKMVHETQGAFFTGQQAHDFAVSGTVAVPRNDMPCVSRSGLVPAGVGHEASARQEGPGQVFVVGPGSPVLPSGAGPAAAVTLAEAVAAGLFVSKEAARKAAQRQGWEPAGGDKTAGFEYALTDLYAYKQARGRR